MHFKPPRTMGRFIRDVLLTVLFLVVLLFVAARLHLRHQIHAEFASIRAAGQPVTLVELGQQFRDLGGRPDGSDELNSALQKVVSLSRQLRTNGIPGVTNRLQDLPLVGRGSIGPPDHTIDPLVIPAVQLALKETVPSLNELRIVLARTNQTVRFPIDLAKGMGAMLPHLMPLKQTANWLALQSAGELAEDNPDDAVADIADALRLSRTLEAEPILISQLVRFSMLRGAIDSIIHLIDFHALSREHAQFLQSELRYARPENSIHLAMLGERCIGLDAMYFRPQPLTMFDLQVGSDAEVELGPQLLMVAYRMSGLASRDVRFYLATMNEVISVATNRVPERIALSNNGTTFNPRNQGKISYILSSMLLPNLEKAFVKEADCLSAITAAAAALSVEAFRADHQGKLPTNLKELVPVYAGEVPTDPSTGRPLSLVPNPSGPGYSIHANGPLFNARR